MMRLMGGQVIDDTAEASDAPNQSVPYFLSDEYVRVFREDFNERFLGEQAKRRGRRIAGAHPYPKPK